MQHTCPARVTVLPELNNDSASADNNHEHGAASADGFIVDVEAYNGICAYGFGSFHKFGHSGLLAFAQNLFVAFDATAESIAQVCKEILKDVGADNGFGSYDLLVLACTREWDGPR